jgi:hypothetical protein
MAARQKQVVPKAQRIELRDLRLVFFAVFVEGEKRGRDS